jgi:N-acetylgalactosamine-6-sulfatase
MTGLDAAMGRLFDHLDQQGLADNTVIVMSSDNGPEDYHAGNARNAGIGYPGVFRGRKRSIYEGGVRVPLLVRWPGKVPAGRRDDASTLTAVDLLPTVSKLAGIDASATKSDGEDVSDIWRGKSRPRTKPIHWEWRGGITGNQEYKPPRLAIRDGQWKLFVEYDGRGAQLYDIPNDPEERTNLASAQPEVVKRLTDAVLAWQKTLPETAPPKPSKRD